MRSTRSTPRPDFEVNVRLPAALEPYDPDTPILDDALLTARQIVEPRLADQTAHLVELEECRWQGGTLSGSRLTKLTGTDQQFTGTDLALVKAPEASLTRLRWEQCRMSGIDLAGCTASQVEVVDAIADYASWRMARLQQVRFERCRLSEADFTGARFDQVVFRQCDLTDAEFSSVEVRHAWFVDCTWLRTGGIASLRGSTFVHSDPTDALGLLSPFAAALGITLAASLDTPG